MPWPFTIKRGKSFLYLNNNSYLKCSQIKAGMNFYTELIFELNSYDYILHQAYLWYTML